MRKRIDFDVLPHGAAILGSFNIGFALGVVKTGEKRLVLIDSHRIDARPPRHDASAGGTAGTDKQSTNTAKQKEIFFHIGLQRV
jgi:hypothetical protein